ncbi:phosphoglycerate dehydrogenase [Marinilactibacillus kalidii]|uniref:phosphoglycerate dehydrogenase n=1 Tax=Marinilactibacillus kalidii TaxID=2820274 RepID=UPI001ABE9329|nr:phosphoglycerate dehydrogenase [Marinilactibacillus kalidii]
MSKYILAFRELESEQQKRIEELAPDYKAIRSIEDADAIENIEVLYSWNKDKGTELLENKQNQIKWIQTASAGIDYLDLESLENQEIVLTNSSGIHAKGIAESTMAMILNYTRGIGHSVKAQMDAKWSELDTLIELEEKTILIVGTGAIGKQVGKLAKAFDMKTIGINRSGEKAEHMDVQHTQDELSEVIGQADVVVNILPLTDETENFFDKEQFSKMKNQSIFINVGRGGSVVTDDLIDALEDGKLAYAGLDVLHEEPLPEDHPLWKRDDVLITPHISGHIENYDRHLFPIFEKNLEAFVKGESLPINVVDYTKGY